MKREKTRYQQFINYLNQIKKSDQAFRLNGYNMKDSVLKVYLYLYCEGYININNLDDFIYILDNSTLCPCNTEIIDKNNYTEYSLTKKNLKNSIIILHYADPKTRTIKTCNIMISKDINNIIKFVSNNINNFVVKGGLWFDKINGNTYNSAIIYDLKNNKTYQKPFSYGYGHQYYYEAIDYLIDNKIIPNVKEIRNYYQIFKDLGSQYMKKAEAKNYLY